MNNAPFVFGNQAPANNVANGNFAGRQAKNVDAWLNLSLPRADGTTVKLGNKGIPITFDEKDPAMKELATFLQTDEGAEWFKQNLLVQCNIVTGAAPKAGFDFNL